MHNSGIVLLALMFMVGIAGAHLVYWSHADAFDCSGYAICQ